MDEKSLTLAAEEAINDLQLDCQVNEVCRSPKRDEWCIQFTGKYGQFCDEFKNQFGKENSSEVAREKIKSYLLKQITKIRSSTGRKRAGGRQMAKKRESGNTTSGTPLKAVESVIEQATKVVSPVIDQASAAAKTVIDTAAGAASTVTSAARNASPVTVEVRRTSRRS